MLRILPVEVRPGPPLRATPTGEAHCDRELADDVIKSWQMRYGEAHCDQELADEVRRGGQGEGQGEGEGEGAGQLT